MKFKINDKDPSDQYARLYADDVVDAINHLNLPRYGLGNYLAPSPHEPPTQAEAKVIQDLSRAGKRLMGFCRTNLFKRLESSGQAFLQSVERHILRNCVCLHAIDNDLPLPIGTQDAELLDSRFSDDDEAALFERRGRRQRQQRRPAVIRAIADRGRLPAPRRRGLRRLRRPRTAPFQMAAPRSVRQGTWLRTCATDIQALLDVLKSCGEWDPDAMPSSTRCGSC